jgi:hypothetical protein
MVRRWKDRPRPAIEVSMLLIKIAEDLFDQAVYEEDGI